MKFQEPSTKIQTNSNTKIPIYDLEERTYRFAVDCRQFIRQWPRTITNIEDAKQLARSSGSVAANYIEANESLSKKDFAHRIRICRKEAKESRLWLRLCAVGDLESLRAEQCRLANEATELVKIFTAILEKSV